MTTPPETTWQHDIESAGQDSRSFEDLTLAQVIGLFLRSPVSTWRALAQVAQSPIHDGQAESVAMPDAASAMLAPQIHRTDIEATGYAASERAAQERVAFGTQVGVLVVRLAAIGLALLGTAALHDAGENRIPIGQTGLAFGLLILAGLAWVGSEFLTRRQGSGETEDDSDLGHGADIESMSSPQEDSTSASRKRRYPLVLVGLGFSALTWFFTADNRFTTAGFWAWIVSIVLWVAAVAPADRDVRSAIQQTVTKVRAFRPQSSGTFWALMAIVLLGAVFRLSNLQGIPPEMTSDHVEKLLDAQRVLDGTHQVFFPNNGGREPFQMYAMALFSRLPGLGMNFTTLKLLAVLEGLITLPVMWWLGREITGKDRPELGNLVGLALAGLVAASYWHTAITRLALRIVLTPLVTALLVIYLSRALRYNRRGDFIKTGLVLGFSLYTYQATRMFPFVVLLGVLLALALKGRSAEAVRRYALNLVVLVLIAFVVFVPMFRFSVDYPEHFWRRTTARLLGDDIIQTVDEQGNPIERNPTLEERLEALNGNLPVLLDNINNVLLMFHWKSDVAWINAVPNRPALDIVSGALMITGVAAWFALMVKRRDAAQWLIPPMLLLMLIPSALAIAYPIENPSATRTSGALPEVYLLAALPLALVRQSLIHLKPGKVGRALATTVGAAAILIAFRDNSALYFNDYPTSYLNAAWPYSTAGRVMRDFAESGGSYGNAFMIATPYWWDHRAVGLEAGLVDWPNGIVSLDEVPNFLFQAAQRTDSYRFDPNLDLLFFYKTDEEGIQNQLQAWFPSGAWQLMTADWPGGAEYPHSTFKIFRVPPLGEEGFAHFLELIGVHG